MQRKIFDNLYRSWQRILKTAKILEEDEDFDQDLSGFSKIFESLVPILGNAGTAFKRLRKMGLGLKKMEKKIEIVNVRPDTTRD